MREFSHLIDMAGEASLLICSVIRCTNFLAEGVMRKLERGEVLNAIRLAWLIPIFAALLLVSFTSAANRAMASSSTATSGCFASCFMRTHTLLVLWMSTRCL